MERRKSITVAATASLTLLAGAAGMALNSELLSASANGGAGEISPVSNTVVPASNVRAEDDPGVVGSPPVVTATEARPTATSSGSAIANEDHDEQDHDEQDHDERSADHHEYEGADDDD